MRNGQILAVITGVALSATQARAEDPQPPIVVQPAPEQPVVVQPPAQPQAQPPIIETAPPVIEQQPAYTEPVPPPPPPVSTEHPKKEHKHNKWFAPGEASVTVGGGVADFVGSSMRAATEVGAQWDARVTIGTRSLVAFEAGYMGTYNKLQSPVEGNGSVAPYLVNNSVDGDFRLNLLPFRIQPYIFGGLGYNHASMNNLQDSPAMAQRFRSSDDQLLVPAGAGLAFYVWNHATFDTRFTYRAVFLDELDRTADTRLDQWVVNGRLGYAF
jgi:hypothetical protein